ncbi:unnamed protein product, partial [Prorocentrum cordatum]
VLRWRTRTDVPKWKQADRFFRALDQDQQRKLKDIDDDALTGSRGIDEIIARSDLLADERHGGERWKFAREYVVGYIRKQGDNHTEYCARVDPSFGK